MRVLLDTCVASQAKAQLQAVGHDVVWSGDWEEDPGDEAILATAYREGRTLITIDKDFGELAVLRGAPHFGILRPYELSRSRARSRVPAGLGQPQ